MFDARMPVSRRMNALAGVRRHPRPRKRARQPVEPPASARTPHEAWRTRSAIASRAAAQASKPASTIRQASRNRLPFAVCSARLASAGGRQDGWPLGVEGWLRPACRKGVAARSGAAKSEATAHLRRRRRRSSGRGFESGRIRLNSGRNSGFENRSLRPRCARLIPGLGRPGRVRNASKAARFLG
jgi:hypothetical protein